uniref:Microtubule-associated protein 1A/B/S-like MBL-like domain-containing protein n=1 Tax=Periophthalmus magnuspinnatus TaxID=409849 RepID=A0A3B4B1F9_9GOBI
PTILCSFGLYLNESLDSFRSLPSSCGGFLRLSRPCVYVFPGGRGDSALVGVSGYSLLVNGGDQRKSCFWRLVRHLDRLDAVLITHTGADNLPGINGFLQRKVEELRVQEELRDQEKNQDWIQNLVSPEVRTFRSLTGSGPVQFRRSAEEAALTLRLIERLDLEVMPLTRGPTPEPLVLFSKLGVGRLDMYVLCPDGGSAELDFLRHRWTGSGCARGGVRQPDGTRAQVPVPFLASGAVLLVWTPFEPDQSPVRVLFPGNAPQSRVLEGLHRLRHLDFLRTPTAAQTKTKVSTLR